MEKVTSPAGVEAEAQERVHLGKVGIISWQQKDGHFPLKGWVVDNGNENTGYSTAFATLVLWVPEARLSIYNRSRRTCRSNHRGQTIPFRAFPGYS